MRTDEERVAAVESMFRIRAVESPPDEQGLRTIWHRGLKGAELVSEVDGSGRVIRQELSLFDDVVVWAEGTLRTGQSTAPTGGKSPKPSQSLTWDPALTQERVDRIARALEKYRGADRFIQHVRDLLGVRDEGPPLIDAPITRTAQAIREESASREALARDLTRAAARRSRLGLLAIVTGGVIVLGALLLLWLSLGSD